MTSSPSSLTASVPRAPRERIDQCLVCGSSEVESSFEAPLQMAPPEESFTFSLCGDCGLLYLADRVRPEEVHRYYEDSYLPYRGAAAWGVFEKFVEKGEGATDRTRVRRLLDFGALGSSDRVLDVGCGKPTFLRKLHAKTKARCLGIDFGVDPFLDDPKYAGIDLVSGDPRHVELEGTFSAITMWHYLEHDYNPSATLRRLLPHTRADTTLLIEVPDGRSRARGWAGNQWAGLHTPRHTAIYTPGTMAHLLEASGWRVVASELPPTLDPWVLWWLTWRERRGTDWARSMARYLPEFLLGMLVLGPVLRRLSNDVLLVAARPS